MSEPENEPVPARAEPRRSVALILITAATGLALGVLLRQPSQMAANDISRWCTVWSLLERGTFAIDECPWTIDTQDKVFRAPGSRPGEPEPTKHYYSSKPQLLPALIAGLLYPARRISGVPLDQVVLQEREPRWVQKPDPSAPGGYRGLLEKPPDPVKWPAYVYYFDAVLILINVLPFAVFLVLYARVLDRYATNDWAWYFCLFAGAFGTYLLPFTQTLNNHTIAAFSVFFSLYHFLRLWDEWETAGWRFAAVGFFAAFAAVNELPALAFLGLIGAVCFCRYPRKTLLFLVPATLFPVAASVAAQYVALGELTLVYSEFGAESYLYEGSLWKSPLELDALNLPWIDPDEATRRGIVAESYAVYLFHMTLGHHGVWSLSPIFLFSLAGLVRCLGGGGRLLGTFTVLTALIIAGVAGAYFHDPADWVGEGRLAVYRPVFYLIPALLVFLAVLGAFMLLRRGGQPMASVAWMAIVLTTVVLAFYTLTTKARNYGGSTQGLRWLFWLIPFWLLLLPRGVEGAARRPVLRTFCLLALGISVLSVGYAMRNPWSHPWILDALEHLGLYPLPR